MKRFNLLATIGLLFLCLNMAGCVEEASIGYLGFDIDPTLTVDPVSGQGYRLSVKLTNFKGEFDKAGFIITNYLQKDEYTNTQQTSEQQVEVQDPTQFSTLVSLTSPLYRSYTAYAYIVVGGMEFRTDVRQFEIKSDVVSDPDIQIDSFEVDCKMPSASFQVPLEGQITVHGHGFMPFDKVDDRDELFRSGFLKLKSSNEGFKAHFVSSTETEMHLSYTSTDFGLYDIVITQGDKPATLHNVEVAYPNHILSPEQPLRAYEVFYPTFANDLCIDQFRLYQRDDLIPSYSWTYFELPCRFTPDQQAYDLEQRISGHGNMPLVHLAFSTPWEKVASLGKDFSTNGTFCLDGEMWWRDGSSLYRFDPQSLTATELKMPGFYTDDCSYVLGKADDGTLLLRLKKNYSTTAPRLYRYSFQTEEWELIEVLYDSTDKFQLLWQEGQMLYEIRNNQLCITDISAEEWTTTTEDIDIPTFQSQLLYKEGNCIVGYSSRYRFFSYDLTTDQTTYFDLPALDELDNYRTYQIELTYAPVVRRGDWLYYHRQPLMRVNMSDGGQTKEYLGAPLGRHEKMFLLPYDDQVLAIDSENGDIYRFVEDR